MNVKHFYCLSKILKQQFFYRFILVVIVINAMVIGLLTSPEIEAEYGIYLHKINQLCLFIFIVEFIIRLYVYRCRFFKRKWDMFDLLVIAVSLLPEAFVFSTFRFLRIIRILRLISIIPKIQFITQVLLRTLSSIVSIGILLMVVYYIYAVIVTTLIRFRLS